MVVTAQYFPQNIFISVLYYFPLLVSILFPPLLYLAIVYTSSHLSLTLLLFILFYPVS